MATMKTSEKGLLAIAAREAIVLSAYRDSVGVWTIGIGHTAPAGPPAPAAGMRITLGQALSLFRHDIARYEADVNRAVRVPLAQYEFDALVSFHYNTGAIARAKLTEALNRGDRAGAARLFMGWVQPVEILSRRKAEQRQFASGDYGDTSHALVYDAFPGKAHSTSTVGLLGGAVARDSTPASLDDAPAETEAPLPPRPPTYEFLHGQSSPVIEQVQDMLVRLGYTSVGEVDSKWGANTAGAISEFRNDRHLPVGTIDQVLIDDLERA